MTVDKHCFPLPQQHLKKIIPPAERLTRGPCVMIECLERIPCNPCVDVCPSGAILITGKMVEVPEVDLESCTGCGKCVAVCPGLAIFLLDLSHARPRVSLPYEMLPLPKVGKTVLALDRNGKAAGKATVIKLVTGVTPVVTIALEKDLSVMEIRNIKVID